MQQTMHEKTVDDVIEQMDEIVARCRRERSHLGYFAALYRSVTLEVRKGIREGRFEDGSRMERLDVNFANRYLEAWEQYQRGERPTESWQFAFEMGERGRLLVLQHLLLGMNAHINLDLGIAAAKTCPGPSLPALRRDFEEINNILAMLFDDVKDGLATISPTMWLLDRAVSYTDRLLVSFRIEQARHTAWEVATRLAPLSEEEQRKAIARLDQQVRARAALICATGTPLEQVFYFLARIWPKDVVKVIDSLCISR